MGRKRRRGKRRSSAKPVGGSLGSAMADQRTKQRAASSAKEAASKRAQQALNKSQQAEGKAMQSSVAGKYQNQAQQTGSAPSMTSIRAKGGSLPVAQAGGAVAQGLQGAPRPGRGRGKGSRPIAQAAGGREMGGGFRNRAFGMGREQRGFGMGRINMEEQTRRGFGMGRDQRGMGMGREGMMRGRGYGSVAGERAKGGSKPTSGVRSQGTRINSLGMEVPRGQEFRSKPAGMGRRRMPQGRPMAPQVRQAPQTSSFNPSTGRMEFASTPNNFSRGSQTMRMPFRKSMKSQGGFKLPPKSQIQK